MYKSNVSGRVLWALSPLALAVALVGCGDDKQDRGVRAAEPTPMAGLVIDGYLARARVYLDQDGNGLQDPWEPNALTDEDGYFSYNPRRDIDYCAEPGSLHCLRVRAGDRGVLRAAGGYDELTGEPSTAELSAALPAGGSALLTPFTTLLVESGVSREELLLQLGLNESDLEVDYLAEGDRELAGRAIALHKTVSVLSKELADRYNKLGDEVKLPASPSGAIYRALGRTLHTHNISLPDLTLDLERLRQVSSAAQSELTQRYQAAELTPPAPFQSSTASVVGELSSLADSLFNSSAIELRAAARALELVVQQSAARGPDPAIAAARFMRQGSPDILTGLFEGLSSARVDLSTLTRHDFSGAPFTDADHARNSAQLPATALPFGNVAGQTLRVQDLDLGHAPNALRDIEVEAYFTAGKSATEGPLTACVKYIDEASTNGDLGEGNTRGERVQGHWQLLSPAGGESYNLLLSIQFLGADYQAILKPEGDGNVGGVTYKKLRFDYAGDIRTWHSPTGLVATTSVPANNADCRARLPSRIGL